MVRSSTGEQLAEHLRVLILSGELAQGQALREVEVANASGVSRNTVREAIRVLAREGLVTHTLHKGAVVTELDEAAVEDIYRVRVTLELSAVRAAATASDEALGPLTSAVDDLADAAKNADWPAIVDADQLFHERLVALLRSDRIDRFFNAIQSELRLCLSIVDRSHTNIPALVDEHRQVEALIRARECELCDGVLRAHLVESERLVRTRLRAAKS